MGAKQEDAKLILKLYELRREAVMRQAREWFGQSFWPETAQDVMQTMQGEHSAHLRMVTSYWEMAATLVKHGAIDSDLFAETNGEHIIVYLKHEPVLADLRKTFGDHFLTNLENVVRAMPNSAERLKAFRERMAGWRQASRGAAAKKA